MARTDDASDDETQEMDEMDGGSSPPARVGWLTRILDGPRTAAEPPPDSPRGRRRGMERLNTRERRYSFAATLAAALFSVIIYVSETHNHTFRLAKGQLTPQTTLALGLGAAVLLGVSSYSGRRAPVAFVCLFAFFIFSNGAGIVVGIPFIALAGWLLYRSYKIQREANAERAASRTPDGSKGGTARVTPVRPATASRKKSSARPEPNKRYTPKRPPPPAIKPSRRERKAAEANE